MALATFTNRDVGREDSSQSQLRIRSSLPTYQSSPPETIANSYSGLVRTAHGVIFFRQNRGNGFQLCTPFRADIIDTFIKKANATPGGALHSDLEKQWELRQWKQTQMPAKEDARGCKESQESKESKGS